MIFNKELSTNIHSHLKFVQSIRIVLLLQEVHSIKPILKCIIPSCRWKITIRNQSSGTQKASMSGRKVSPQLHGTLMPFIFIFICHIHIILWLFILFIRSNYTGICLISSIFSLKWYSPGIAASSDCGAFVGDL